MGPSLTRSAMSRNTLARRGATIEATEDLKDPMLGFKVGEKVRMSESSKHDPGFGIVLGTGSKPGVLLVQFDHGIVPLPINRLMHIKSSGSSTVDGPSVADQ